MYVNLWSQPNKDFHTETVKDSRQLRCCAFLCACDREFVGSRACVTDTAKPAPNLSGWSVGAVILNRMLTTEKHTLRARSENNN